MTEIIAISDTHSLHAGLYLPIADILVHAGDITNIGAINDVISFNAYKHLKNYKHKIVIPGNHDFCFQDHYLHTLAFCSNFNVLLDSGMAIDDINFYGTPWQPSFNDWAFNVDSEKELYKKFNKIPKETNVLISHCPPYGILDSVPEIEKVIDPYGKKCYKEVLTGKSNHFGSKALLDVISNRPNIKYHIFGHIHSSYGVMSKDGINFINCSVMNEKYSMVNEPIRIEYEKQV